jgi:hypothetical protein
MTELRLLDYWSPPDGAGQPLACLATSFTFESSFFTDECLARFLSLSNTSAEGDKISSIVALLEEEERLSEAQVSVLIDRSTPAEKRNLRWDLLPVNAPGGLLHAKVAALIWERSARIILGSANLTSAGYRRQVELSLAIDLNSDCLVPRAVAEALVAELRRLVELAPGPRTGPKERALKTVDLLEGRVAELNLPTTGSGDLRIAVAPARPGTSPLDYLGAVWRGGRPLRATLLSPFWDNTNPAPAIRAVEDRLTGRPATARSMTFVVGIDPVTQTIQAPESLVTQIESGASIHEFDSPDPDKRRTLHAKLLLLESDQWLAALIGSSNITGAGLGLFTTHGHHELNLWLGCPARSKTAKHLQSLARKGEAIDPGELDWKILPDEDEPTTPLLPYGFVRCTLDASTPPRLLLELDAESVPNSWTVLNPTEKELLTAEDWRAEGSPRQHTVTVVDDALPSYLVVCWEDEGQPSQATWIVNVEDRGALPPAPLFDEISVEVLLAALASTRPLPIALERELRRKQLATAEGVAVVLDPLQRYDDSGLLLQRARHMSLALWRLQERLSRTATSLDTLQWRLNGPVGPIAIADGLARAAADRKALPGETHFLLAELALTIAAVEWDHVAPEIDRRKVRAVVTAVIDMIDERLRNLPAAPDPALGSYARDALKKARR